MPETPANLGRVKSQKALAVPTSVVDQNVDFRAKIGGLEGHIDQFEGNGADATPLSWLF